MKESERYMKIVEWSEEDQCFVGSAPGLIYGDATARMKKPSSSNCVGSWRKPLHSTTRTESRYLFRCRVATTPTKCRRSHRHAVHWT